MSTEHIPTLPWRDMETAPRNGAIFAVWCRSWNSPDGEPRIQFAQWLDPYLTGGKLCAPWDHNNNPYANGWLPLDELSRLTASGIEARQRPDPKGLDPQGESPIAATSGETPNLPSETP